MKNSREIIMSIRYVLANIGLNEDEIKRILDDCNLEWKNDMFRLLLSPIVRAVNFAYRWFMLLPVCICMCIFMWIGFPISLGWLGVLAHGDVDRVIQDLRSIYVVGPIVAFRWGILGN